MDALANTSLMEKNIPSGTNSMPEQHSLESMLTGSPCAAQFLTVSHAGGWVFGVRHGSPAGASWYRMARSKPSLHGSHKDSPQLATARAVGDTTFAIQGGRGARPRHRSDVRRRHPGHAAGPTAPGA